jgi:hypothetical protein
MLLPQLLMTSPLMDRRAGGVTAGALPSSPNPPALPGRWSTSLEGLPGNRGRFLRLATVGFATGGCPSALGFPAGLAGAGREGPRGTPRPGGVGNMASLGKESAPACTYTVCQQTHLCVHMCLHTPHGRIHIQFPNHKHVQTIDTIDEANYRSLTGSRTAPVNPSCHQSLNARAKAGQTCRKSGSEEATRDLCAP